eukprot:gene25793-34377_t
MLLFTFAGVQERKRDQSELPTKSSSTSTILFYPYPHRIACRDKDRVDKMSRGVQQGSHCELRTASRVSSSSSGWDKATRTLATEYGVDPFLRRVFSFYFPFHPPLHYAVEKGDVAELGRLIAEGADVNELDSVSMS